MRSTETSQVSLTENVIAASQTRGPTLTIEENGSLKLIGASRSELKVTKGKNDIPQNYPNKKPFISTW